MDTNNQRQNCGDQDIGQKMYRLVERLFPICRSMTGDGVRQTLAILQESIPLEIREVASGTPAFDWRSPQEWTIRDAYIKDESGNRVVDFRASNLHVVSGSSPICQRMRWRELRPRLHTLPEKPEWIPYRTCFHQENWGFCLAHQQLAELEALGDREYEVCIDSDLKDGSLTYGELYLPGETPDEFLISTHVCHPSLANDNLSGIAVATHVAAAIAAAPRRLSYRFLFLPATIGPIVWLARNEHRVSNIRHGLVLSLLGDPGFTTYKRSRRGNAEIDRAMELVLKESGAPYQIIDFEPFGYDQRQYCSPGFDLPIGNLMRTPNEQYPEYHTSADDLDLVAPRFLADSFEKCFAAIRLLETNRTYLNTNPKCEPRLGKHGLYKAFGEAEDQLALQQAVLWVLNLSDGRHSLLDIAERSRRPYRLIHQAADTLLTHGLLVEADSDTPHSNSEQLSGRFDSLATTNAQPTERVNL